MTLRKKFKVLDPESGHLELTEQTVSDFFTGIALVFDNKENNKESSTSKKVHKPSSVWRYISAIYKNPGVKKGLLTMALLTIFLQLIGLILPFASKVLIDDILPVQDYNILYIISGGAVLFLLSYSLIRYLRGIISLRIRILLDKSITTGFFNHVLSLDYKFFQYRSSGDIISRLNSNTTIRDMFTSQLVMTFIDISLIIVYFLVLASLSLLFSLFTLAFGFMMASLVYFSYKESIRLINNNIRSEAYLESYQYEILKGIKYIKASGIRDATSKKWESAFEQNISTSVFKDSYLLKITEAKAFLERSAPVLLLCVGIYTVMDGSMTLGTMLSSLALAGAFLAPLSSLSTNIQTLQQSMVHVDRIMSVLDKNSENDRFKGKVKNVVNGSIHFKNVGFKFNKLSKKWILKNISFLITEGEKIAIVGKSGAGKSTIADLVLGIMDFDEGTILVGGESIVNYDIEALRSSIGVVLQDSFMFRSSIRENITMNRPDTTYESMVAAAKTAHIHDDIMLMPMKYDTIISEDGLSISGGQRQRLSLARAIIARPKILILDEATSSLDTECELSIDEAINHLSCTRIIISHRQSTVVSADKIIFLSEGKIELVGNHTELLNKSKKYQTLFNTELDSIPSPQVENETTFFSQHAGD